MRKPRARTEQPTYLSPSPSPDRELPPALPASVLPDWDAAIMTSSRPVSGSLGSAAGHFFIVQPPSLAEILANISSPPWTLAAFMAYLSQNHCLETLEFTMDADRYRNAYDKILSDAAWAKDGNDHVCSLWEKLMQAYIIPYAPREVNLPSRVRDGLLNRDYTSVPPPPSELDEAVGIVYELMNDSVLLPFIESLSPAHSENYLEDEMAMDVAQSSRSRSRLHGDATSSRLAAPGYAPIHLPRLTVPRSGANSRAGSMSGEAVDRETLTDDSGSAISPGTEPMTPPTTPPTSEWTFNHSPGGFQRALTAHNNGWKKVGAKLGFNRRSRPATRRPNPTSSGHGDDNVSMSDASPIDPR
ncbi:RGS domain-containing protein [Plectosphaerella plurivora]|uniref:RGS domain-containing protein n=1 Tax=Plectosphaerella plurivora TaxID=936078 RepID=A0A9P8V7H0_9PEZI|nr:RGS domain-containing protein [Plectosphaerella plurivora]